MTFPDRVISGAMHYFRVHPDLWADRLARLAAMGLNTVETYVAWNFHSCGFSPSPSPAASSSSGPGRYSFDGWRDLPRFLSLAAEADLDVILRPGPYICAEWDFGGLPAWLLRFANGSLRCSDPAFLAAVDEWFDALLPQVEHLLATRGGPIVAVQVENEYGSYGSDQEYLARIRDGLVSRGVDVPLFTSDGPGPDWLASGTLPDVLATVNFGSRAGSAFAALREFRPDSPLFCMEFWHGWFDHWGEKHHTRSASEAAGVLDEMLAAGASVNLYMGHGGTNFGLWSGANWDDDAGSGLQPTVTSYDYDAPVGEAGELTEKFWAFREVIAKYAPVPEVPSSLLAPPARLPARSLPVRPSAPLLDSPALGQAVRSPMPLAMEDVGSGRGLILYRGSVLVPPDGRDLILDGLADRAIVFADGQRLATLSPDEAVRGVRLEPRPDRRPVRLDVLVENRGRVNFGHRLGERKGVTGIRLADRFIHDWDCVPVELDQPATVAAAAAATATVAAGTGAAAISSRPAPVFATAAADITAPADGFLALPGWGRGFLWLNGFLLGRYDAVGPQRTLYAPAPLWHAGGNDLVVLELDQPGNHIEITDEPALGDPELSEIRNCPRSATATTQSSPGGV